MKVGILTHYNVSSHGALLQMYGLKKALEEFGHEVFILTYTRNLDFIDEATKKRFSASIKNIPYYLSSYMGEDGLGCLFYQFKKQQVLKKFREDNFKMMPYTESAQLDCVIVGADEVFSLENGVNFVMFGHGITSPRLVAYAPSAGQTDLARVEKFGCKELLASGFGKFTALSARDVGTQQLLHELTGKDAPIVCDPALLYPFPHPVKEKKKYIVVYSYQSNFKDKARNRAIRAYAKKNGCEIWSVGVYYKWCDKKINCDPLEMIRIFANAQAVITDTFHGTITSYIAHTPMAVFVRSNNSVKLEHLLQMIGIENRKVTTSEMLEAVLNTPVDFDRLDRNVENLRSNGIKYLEQSLMEREGNR